MKMKKLFSFVMLGAIALAGATMFNSCSSEDAVPVNPTFDGESVKTQFTIALPGNVAQTRMTAATVQQAQTIASFRGMQNIVIIPYAHATDRTTRLGGNITLGANKMLVPTTTNDANAIPSGQLLGTNNAVLYNDVTIPVGTSAFLFYGKAKGTDGYPEGYLTPEGLTGESTAIFFNPTPIQTTFNSTKGTALATYVNSIAAAADGDAAWWKCTDATNSTQTWYSAALGDLYRSFVSLKPGASAYVQAAVQDLYTTLLNNTDVVSVAIKTAITNSTYVSSSTGGTLTFTDAISNYPGGEYNSMPDGCAALTWADVPAAGVAATKAATATAKTESNFGGGLANVQAMNKVAYPASLYYFVDSPVKTSATSRQADYVDTKTWSQILGTYDATGTSVASTTRSVAITNPIQYAVGRLDLTVTALGLGDYYDRRGDKVTFDADDFQLTGVLIGGQKKVNYKFEQADGDEYAIYDKTIRDGSDGTTPVYLSASAATPTNYTLALETAKNQEVYVAVEFLNNSGKDFMGVDGVVKAGCKFYMIAKLDPKDSNTNAQHQSNTGNKVFKQDFNTIANFTFGAGTADADNDGDSDTPGGFGNAYVTIPDLRTPRLELGFSVNLTWQEGITFNHTF